MPLVGVVAGRCFAGNAVLLGCCDVIIATQDTNLGVGGPAMIEGGGLGVFRPEEVGPMDVQVPNGVVDIAVADEAEAVAVAKQYLSYFQGPVADWECADQRLLRHAIPENRLRIYDVRGRDRDAWPTPARCSSCGGASGLGMVTALARVEGRPIGIVANNPTHLRRRRRQPPAPTRRPASCSCATPSTSPSCSSATRPGSWWGRRPRRRPPCATPPGCS